MARKYSAPRRRRRAYGRRKAYRQKRKSHRRFPRRQAIIGRSFPDRVLTTLDFYEATIDATPTTGFSEVIYRANSPYDPVHALGGKKAQGFAQWAAVYGRYRVYASRITVTYQNVGDSTGRVGITASTTSAATPENDQSFFENTRTKSVRFGPPDGNRGSVTVSQMLPTYRHAGRTKLQVAADDAYEATSTTNPAAQNFWKVLVGLDRAAAIDANVQVRIRYYVMFYAPFANLAT